MLTRRDMLGSTLAGLAAGAGVGVRGLWGVGAPAWPGPIGLAMYTVREQFDKDPAETLKHVAAVGYKEIETGFGAPSNLNALLRDAGLTAPSGYFDTPKTADDWKKVVDLAQRYGMHYLVVGDNPRISIEAWKRRADLFSECGKLSQAAGIQFCYHAHFNEFARSGGTCGYDILLTQCDPALLKIEMDCFWATYAGVDPVAYFERYPGRFPMLHIKDMYKGAAIDLKNGPSDNGPNPFAPVGQGKIDWKRIFAHAGKAGVKHIFVEQDRCNMPPMEAIKISFDYLKNLRLS